MGQDGRQYPHGIRGNLAPDTPRKKVQGDSHDHKTVVAYLADTHPEFTAEDISQHTGLPVGKVRKLMRSHKGETKPPRRSLARKKRGRKTMHPVTKRRLRDGENALNVPIDGETRAQLQSQLDSIGDGIRALQSTDDLGPEMNRHVYEQERELWKRYDAVKAKIAALDQEPCPS